MKTLITIGTLLLSKAVLCSNGCAVLPNIKFEDCMIADMVIDHRLSEPGLNNNTELSSYFKSGTAISTSLFSNTGRAVQSGASLLSESSVFLSEGTFDYVPDSLESDVQFNIVYETFVSMTYQPWKKVWFVDHFMFEYLTDKYRNEFFMFTLKIDLL